MKSCSKCKINKSLSEFNKLKQSKDGFQYSCKECQKIWIEENKDNIAKQKREYYSQNRDKILNRCKDYRENNKEKEKLRHALYHATDMGKVVRTNSDNKRRSLKKKSLDGSIPQKPRDYVNSKALIELREEQNNKCAYCECNLDYDTPRAVHLDHVIPLAKGGTHTIDNVVWSCADCNMTKSDKLIA